MSHRSLATTGLRERLRRLLRRAGWSACAVVAAWSVSPLSAADPIYSRSRKFRIPFQFDVAELRRIGAREIQLYISSDQGTRWQAQEAVSPDQAKFPFEAPDDGEYWFSVKTRTAGGLEYPAGPHQPGLRVIVDSAPPEIHLSVSEVEPGRVRLSWDVIDAAPDTESLKIETLDPASTTWQPLSLRPQKQGEITWTIPEGGAVLAQASVSDLAGNTTSRKVEGKITGPNPKPRPVDDSQPIAEKPRTEASGVMANAPPPKELLVRPQPQRFPASQAGPVKAPAAAIPAPIANVPPPQPRVEAPALPPAIVEVRPEPLAALPNPQIAPLGVAPIALPAATAPAAVQHRVNSSKFKINYEIDGVGSSGVGNVELYITENGGHSWFHFGADPDRVSPFEVNVPTDGQYGFAFRVSNGLGLVELPPQPGERPEVSILVDRTAPQAKLWPIVASGGETSQHVTITWTAGDPDLAQNPISLMYSPQPGGPWEPISLKQGNTGRHQWLIPSHLTQKFYVRLEVADAAGNVTAVESDQPFLVDRARPKARVKMVESLTPTVR